jgi:Membrane protein of 12 TMs
MPSEPSPVAERGWRDAWELARPAYQELAFQAIFAVRQGNPPPQVPAEELGPLALRRVRQSKLLISGVLAVLAFGTLLAFDPSFETRFIVMPRGLYVASVLAALLVLELTLLWWTGLQVLPAYLASGIVPLLGSLPVDPVTLRRVALILLARLFDAPALTVLIATPIAVGIALDSPFAALLVVPGVIAAVLLAVALALVTGRFFLRRVQGAPGGLAPTVLRWFYLVLWAVPAFTMYGFLAIAPGILRYIAGLALVGPASVLTGLFAVFPFPFAALPAMGANLELSGPFTFAPLPVALALGAYGTGLVFVAAWLSEAPLRLASEGLQGAPTTARAPVGLTLLGPAAAVLRKDLRTASRSPGYALLILLPLLDATALGLWTYIAAPLSVNVLSIAIGAVVSAALLATFFGPAFFAIEVMGYSYVRTLPVTQRSVLRGKVALVGLIYLTASGVVVGLTLLRIFSPLLFVGFALAELPAILAASILELALLFRRARRRDVPITNLYAGAWWAFAVSIPGLVAASAPLVVFELLKATSTWVAVDAMALLGMVELTIATPYWLSDGGGRPV